VDAGTVEQTRSSALSEAEAPFCLPVTARSARPTSQRRSGATGTRDATPRVAVIVDLLVAGKRYPGSARQVLDLLGTSQPRWQIGHSMTKLSITTLQTLEPQRADAPRYLSCLADDELDADRIALGLNRLNEYLKHG
jgi:hypothetical protein